jgi:hypothetical protein
MFKQISVVAVLMMAGASAGAQCYFSGGYLGEYIQASENQYERLRVSPTQKNKENLVKICNETHSAVQCQGHSRTYDQVVRHPSEFGVKEYTNYGAEYAVLTIRDDLPEWISQFVPNDYEGREYASVQACESHRAEIAMGAVRNAQIAIRYQEQSAGGNQPEKNKLYTPGKL